MVITTPDWDWKDHTYRWIPEARMGRQICSSDELLLLEKYRLDPKNVRVQLNLMVFHEGALDERVLYEQDTDSSYPKRTQLDPVIRKKILLATKKL